MLHHWMTHYLNLGMNLFIYERDGLHRHVLARYIQPPMQTQSRPDLDEMTMTKTTTKRQDALLGDNDHDHDLPSSSAAPMVVYYPYTVHGYLFDKLKPKEKREKQEKREKLSKKHHHRFYSLNNRSTFDGKKIQLRSSSPTQTQLRTPAPAQTRSQTPTPIQTKTPTIRETSHRILTTDMLSGENYTLGNNNHNHKFQREQRDQRDSRDQRDQFQRGKQQRQQQQPTHNKHNLRFADNDKTDTLTWCRFDARTQYGLTDILVVDYDEFIYCPRAKASFSAQVGDPRRFNP